ncbi:temptin-like isoform X2 [Sycon ciliatum]|uniref:temptin-like isoform X2 n=1 Tax=Sycon ciliatum TaxID=27933 RepID=UPI0031F66D4D
MKVWIAALCGALLVHSTAAFLFYQPRVPNAGDRSKNVSSRVPAPYGISNTFCDSVGHVASCTGPPSGRGNPFGKAFNSLGRMWSDAICMADSDGDGVANGAELGDPNCTFTQGGTPTFTTGISHPGFACSTAADPFCLSSPVSQFMTAPTGGSGVTTGK